MGSIACEIVQSIYSTQRRSKDKEDICAPVNDYRNFSPVVVVEVAHPFHDGT
jgi:hypothetical protein